jgi:hypothetical protein
MRDKLASGSFFRNVLNFFANFSWALVWLGKWSIRLLKGLFRRL